MYTIFSQQPIPCFLVPFIILVYVPGEPGEITSFALLKLLISVLIEFIVESSSSCCVLVTIRC